jgi:hypothetical protein
MGLLKRGFQVTVSWEALQKTDFWDPAFCHRVSLGLFTAILYVTSFQAYCKMWICSLELVSCPCIMALSHTSFLQYGNSWTTCSWKNGCDKVEQQHGQLVPLGASKLYLLCYRNQWRPGLATTNREWMWDESFDTWNFPASQVIIVLTCNILRWGSRWTLWALSPVVRRP